MGEPCTTHETHDWGEWFYYSSQPELSSRFCRKCGMRSNRWSPKEWLAEGIDGVEQRGRTR